MTYDIKNQNIKQFYHRVFRNLSISTEFVAHNLEFRLGIYNVVGYVPNVLDNKYLCNASFKKCDAALNGALTSLNGTEIYSFKGQLEN